MPRYFIEVAYKGTRYSGFQVQDNATTIQSEITRTFKTLHRAEVILTGSSRTDAGVHAFQNYFHFDFEEEINPQFIYKMNAMLPDDIVVKQIHLMVPDAHARFDAVSREYEYHIHKFKNPFLRSTSYFYPYRLDMELMNKAADLVKGQTNFFAFAKTNTQVKNFKCVITKSEWILNGDQMSYRIAGNRFLRGMVRLVTASLLKVGRHKMEIEAFEKLFDGNEKCGYSVPSHGLFLKHVKYPEKYFPLTGLPFSGF